MESLSEILEQRASLKPSREAYIVIGYGAQPDESITWETLARRVRTIATSLGPYEGLPVGLIFPTGLDFISSFLGCISAGAVAVPLPPTRYPERLAAVVNDCKPELILGAKPFRSLSASLESTWLDLDALEAEAVESWSPTAFEPERIAMMQYTSGSTCRPRGVRVSHANLAHNERAIQSLFGLDATDVILGWLPLFHDMGLIGTVLQALWTGARAVLMSPAAFLRRPERWLRAISEHRATVSGGPNFAFDLCERTLPEPLLVQLDLSCWRIAFNGAEPIRAQTLERFAARFERCGFSRQAFLPCYGLAEATLLVSGAGSATAPVIESFDSAWLEQKRAVKAPHGRALVSSGKAAPGVEISIVNTDISPLPEGEIGEVMVGGGSVAAGYLTQPPEYRDVFSGTGVLTGDLGFLLGGELFVVGRIKDLMIVRGRNIVPSDMEQLVEASHPVFRPGASTAFSVDDREGGRIVVVASVAREARRAETTRAAVAAARAAVATTLELSIDELILVEPRSVPRTSSGKVRRSACRESYLSGTLAIIARSRLEDDAASALAGPGPLAERLTEYVSILLGIPSEAVDPSVELTRLGLDSLQAVRMQHDLEQTLGREVGLGELLAAPNLVDLASRVEQTPLLNRLPRSGERTEMSAGQQALWFMQRLAPESTAYNIARAVRVFGPLQTEKLDRALSQLLDRHEQLRARFPEIEGRPFAEMAEPGRGAGLEVCDARNWSHERLMRKLLERAHRPFVLAQGSLFRVTLFQIGPDRQVLFFNVHHIVCDLWSLAILVDELGRLLAGEALEPLAESFAEHVEEEKRWNATFDGQRCLARSLAALGSDPPRLALPLDRARPAQTQFRGRAVPLRLGAQTLLRLMRLAENDGASLHTVVLACYEIVLHRISGQGTVMIGVPTAGRTHASTSGVVGNFVNPIVIRSDFSPAASFHEHLGRTKRRLFAALDLQRVPFVELVEKANISRSQAHAPIFQTVLNYNGPGMPGPDALSRVGLIAGAASWRQAGLTFVALALPERSAQFDLTCTWTPDADGGLVGELQFDSSIFEPGTIEEFGACLVHSMESLARQPDKPLREQSLLDEQRLHRWKDRACGSQVRSQLDFGADFEAAARRRPEAIAVDDGEHAWSYGRLAREVDQLSRTLSSSGVGPENVVAVMAQRGVRYLQAILALLKCGAAYMPLSVRDPGERIRENLKQSRAVALLVDRPEIEFELDLPGLALIKIDGEVGDEHPTTWPVVNGLHLAYVIFTSGSTGRPKGAMVHYAGMKNHLDAMRERLDLGPQDVMAQTAPVASDISVWQFLMMACCGGRVEVFADDVAEQPARLLDALEHRGVTLFQTVPSLLEMLIREAERRGDMRPPLKSLRWLSPCGEALPSRLVHRWFALYPRVPLVNAFGPAECSDDVTLSVIDRPPEPDVSVMPIGFPLRNIDVYVLDRFLKPAPRGIVGQIWIGGLGVGRGYLGQPRLTAQAFRPDPFALEPGTRMYATGDLARVRGDGQLEFLGRSDTQVKIRGFRVELGEIESALTDLPDVSQAAVLVRGDRRPELVAYASPAQLDPRDLRAALCARLPPYMIPTSFIFLPRLPLNASNKIDRRALPAPAAKPESESGPADLVESVLMEIWSRRICVASVDRRANFFELGGHSLLAIEILDEVQRTLGAELCVRDLFDHPHLDDLAKLIREGRRKETAVRSGSWPPPEAQGPVRPSFAQSRLWFLWQLNPDDPAFNMPGLVHLRGPLDQTALWAALNDLIKRHDSLRMTFTTVEGEPFLNVAEELVLEPRLSRGDALALAAAEARRPFDLKSGPLIRCQLVEEGPDTHALIINIHHIVFDGWSTGIFLDDLASCYRARTEGLWPQLSPLPLSYYDFCHWQRQHFDRSRLAELVARWRKHFGDAAPPLVLPLDKPAGDRDPSRRDERQGTRVAFEIPCELAAALRRLSARANATLFMTILAGFEALLYRYSGAAEFGMGTLIANRDEVELQRIVGLFMNTIVLRTDLRGDPTCSELIARVRHSVLDAHQNSALPFDALVEALNPRRESAPTPLFSVMFVLQSQPAGTRRLGLVDMEVVDLDNSTAVYDLTLDVNEAPGALPASFRFDSDRFEPASIERMAEHLLVILRALTVESERRLSSLPWFADEERQLVVELWNQTDSTLPQSSFIDLFADQCRRSSDVLAASDPNSELTYGQLNNEICRVASALTEQGLGNEEVIAVMGQRSVDMLVALVGVLAAGGVYLPIEPGLPERRMMQLLSDSGCRCVLSTTEMDADTRDSLRRMEIRIQSLAELRSSPTEADEFPATFGLQLAYLIFTSGSTGTPKGAMVTHQGTLNHLLCKVRDLGLGPSDVVAEASPQGFDVSIWQFLAALIAGGSTYVLAEADSTDPVQVLRELGARHVSVYETVPSFLRALIEELEAQPQPPGLPALRWLMVTGEPLPEDLCTRWLALYPEVPIMNAYGPTECSDDVTHHVIRHAPSPGSRVPIGRPLGNTRIYVLDQNLQPLPIGVVGELCVGGVGVGRGYCDRPQLTAPVFVPDPFSGRPGARMYRTGDLARLMADGEIELIGRQDQQLKIRGRRVEPGEIEAVLRERPEVRDVAAAADNAGRLIAYLVTDPDVDPRRIKADCETRLPAYMVPDQFVILEQLPLNRNGKLDRAALQVPSVPSSRSEPRTKTERAVAEIAGELLGLPSVDPEANFFDLGGYSLLATRLVASVRRRFGVEIPLARFFESPSVRRLAALADGGVNTPVGCLEESDSGQLHALSVSQERLWFLAQLRPEGSAYLILSAVRFSGRLDIELLQRALDKLLERHTALRVTFVSVDGAPRQRVMPPGKVQIRRIDVGRVTSELVSSFTRSAASQPMDLERGPLLRVDLLHSSATDSVAFFIVHHLVADGWSMDLLVRELATIYKAYARGKLPPEPAPRPSYFAYANAQRQWLDGPQARESLAYWVKTLSGAPPTLDLPGDFPRSSIPSTRAATTMLELSQEDTERLHRFCRDQGATPFMVTLTAFAVVLRRLTGREDLVIGTDAACRDRFEAQELVGLIVNQLALRLDLSGQPGFVELLQRVRRASFAAYGHQDLPFHRVVEALNPPRLSGRLPIVQVKVVYRDQWMDRLSIGSLTAEPLYLDEVDAESDVLLSVIHLDGKLRFSLCYQAALFKSETVDRMLSNLGQTIRVGLEHPLDPLTFAEIGPSRGSARSPGRAMFRPTVAKPLTVKPPEPEAGPEAPLLAIEAPTGTKGLAQWLGERREELEEQLTSVGGLRFCGFGVHSLEAFEEVVSVLCNTPFRDNPEHEPCPTTDIAQTPVSYPADVRLRCHNENTFNHEWPTRILFCCTQPAASGGETLVVDNRELTKRLDHSISDRFERLGILYHRVYWQHLERPWQKVFRTKNPEEVDRRCREAGAVTEWPEPGRLHTRAHRPAFARHPLTGEKLWVGQIQIWHPAAHDPTTTGSLREMFSTEELPRYCTFGDGSPIPDQVVRQITELYDELAVGIRWQRGDVVVLDNLLAAHGRNPYQGPRNLFVALGDVILADEAGWQ